MAHLETLHWQAVLDRGGHWKACCDLCGKREYRMELHHICSRGRSNRNSVQRSTSEVIELMAWLCNDCHQRAHNPQIAAILLRSNIRRYGRRAVKRAFMVAPHGGIKFPPLRARRLKIHGKEIGGAILVWRCGERVWPSGSIV